MTHIIHKIRVRQEKIRVQILSLTTRFWMDTNKNEFRPQIYKITQDKTN